MEVAQGPCLAAPKPRYGYELGLSQEDMAKNVVKIGGGHPTQRAISKLLVSIAEDLAGWYPGKGIDER